MAVHKAQIGRGKRAERMLLAQQELVYAMADSKLIGFNVGPFEYKGKTYSIAGQLREMKRGE